MASGGANSFFKLIEQFRTQDEPAFCGLASVAMVLNSLAIDPRRPWKGPWRWFHEEMLDCCHPLERVRRHGVTLHQAACLARCNGAAVEVYPAGCVPLETFRDMVRDACASDTDRIIVAYCRKDFLQTGDGHHSPIGAYSAAEDLVLILDTARFKYPPHWVPLPLLYKSMGRTDPSTKARRGFMRLGSRPRLDSVLFTLDLRDQGCAAAAQRWIDREAPALIVELGQRRNLEEEAPDNVLDAAAAARRIVSALARSAPLSALVHFMAVRSSGSSCHAGSVCIQRSAVQLLLDELRQSSLYSAVADAIPAAGVEGSALPCAAHPACSAGEAAAPPASPRGPKLNATCCSAHAPPVDGEPPVPGTCGGGQPDWDPLAPAAEGPLLQERLVVALLMLPKETWRALPDSAVRQAVLDLVDISTRKSMCAETWRGAHMFWWTHG